MSTSGKNSTKHDDVLIEELGKLKISKVKKNTVSPEPSTVDSQGKSTEVVDFKTAFKNDAITGHYGDELIQTLKKKITPYTRTCVQFKIGKTSNGDTGCASRWNTEHKHLGYTNMICIYKSQSSESVNKVERDLIEKFEQLDTNSNKNKGGGGSTGKETPHVVYLIYESKNK